MSEQAQAQSVLVKLKEFLHARTMREHWQTYSMFDESLLWDAPPILLNGREKLRVVAYFAKRITKLDFEEHSSAVERNQNGQKQVKVVCTFLIKILPEFLHIPTIKVNATVKLGVTDDFQKVTSIYGRLHSFPCLPNFMRRTNAFVLGTVGVATEPWWSKTLWLYGDNSYQNKKH